tara:strand:- start:5203 stop:6105 length:903 start_codon:yes stop_codon:yes gene_type:complete
MIKKDRDEQARQRQARQQSGIAQKQETPKPQNLNSKGSEKANEPTSPSAKRDERKAEQREQRIKLKEYGMKTGGLKGNQKKLDKNNNNRIDSEDFKILRGQGKAPMKARKGKLVPLKKDPTKAISSVKPSAGGKGSGTTNLGNPRKSGENFMERRLKLKGLGKAGRIGAAAAMLGLAGAGAAKLGQTIGRKMSEKKNKKMGGGMMKKPMGYKKGKEIDYGKVFDKKFYSSALGKEAQLHADDYDAGLDRAERRAASETMALMKKNKKMGGGMMMKPMGYKSGTSVKVKCKLGRNKPTKMY